MKLHWKFHELTKYLHKQPTSLHVSKGLEKYTGFTKLLSNLSIEVELAFTDGPQGGE
jgi:hypothetical protein